MKKENTMYTVDAMSVKYDTNYNWAALSDKFLQSEVGKAFENVRLIEERYSYENESIREVVNGNEHKAFEAWKKLNARGPKPRVNDFLRDRKNLCITFNTLLRKTTENNGVHPIYIDAFSNENVCQIEAIKTTTQIPALIKKIIHGYSEMIQNFKLKNYSLPIQKTLTRIHTNIEADLSLSALAKKLNINSSYLSTLFKKETGMTLTEYVNRCRMTRAQHLLLATSLPVKSIALQCGIADLNHFTKTFKRIIGTTPKTFRTRQHTT